MFPNWNNEITLYLRNESEGSVQWERRCFSRCFFKRVVNSEVSDKFRIPGECFTVRIPLDEPIEAPDGSIAVLGSVDDEIPENGSGNELIEKYPGRAFRIQSSSVNTDYLPHIRIGN